MTTFMESLVSIKAYGAGAGRINISKVFRARSQRDKPSKLYLQTSFTETHMRRLETSNLITAVAVRFFYSNTQPNERIPTDEARCSHSESR
jgi:hypothetical protein